MASGNIFWAEQTRDGAVVLTFQVAIDDTGQGTYRVSTHGRGQLSSVLSPAKFTWRINHALQGHTRSQKLFIRLGEIFTHNLPAEPNLKNNRASSAPKKCTAAGVNVDNR